MLWDQAITVVAEELHQVCQFSVQKSELLLSVMVLFRTNFARGRLQFIRLLTLRLVVLLGQVLDPLLEQSALKRLLVQQEAK